MKFKSKNSQIHFSAFSPRLLMRWIFRFLRHNSFYQRKSKICESFEETKWIYSHLGFCIHVALFCYYSRFKMILRWKPKWTIFCFLISQNKWKGTQNLRWLITIDVLNMARVIYKTAEQALEIYIDLTIKKQKKIAQFLFLTIKDVF